MKKPKNKEIAVGVSGSIASFKAVELVSRLSQRNFKVTVIMTETAQKFIQPVTFQSLSGQPVITNLFPNNLVWENDHISVAERINLIIIAPATANIIGKIASGIADDFLTTLAIARTVPLLICPAMHKQMYKNVFVRENIKKLKKTGVYFLGPEKGRLSSGEEGLGRLAEVRKIISQALELLN